MIRSIPEELWRKVKAAAGERGVTIQVLVIEALSAHLKRGKAA